VAAATIGRDAAGRAPSGVMACCWQPDEGEVLRQSSERKPFALVRQAWPALRHREECIKKPGREAGFFCRE
jgi:hypothetical protein